MVLVVAQNTGLDRVVFSFVTDISLFIVALGIFYPYSRTYKQIEFNPIIWNIFRCRVKLTTM